MSDNGKTVTIDELIEQLNRVKSVSPLKGGTVVAVCLPERPFVHVARASLDYDAAMGEPNGLALLRVDPDMFEEGDSSDDDLSDRERGIVHVALVNLIDAIGNGDFTEDVGGMLQDLDDDGNVTPEEVSDLANTFA